MVLVLLLLLAADASVRTAAVGRQHPSLLPILPAVRTWVAQGEVSATLDARTFGFTSAHQESDVLRAALERYAALTFPHSGALNAGVAGAVGMRVNVSDPVAPLALHANESYVLSVAASGTATCASPTVWGALHCLESFSQLVSYDFYSQVYRTPPVLPLRIADEPRFAHRGVMLDCSRHFLPIAQLQSMVDSLAFAKMNVLHLHLTESDSFPMPSRVHPELPQLGAFSSREQYSWADMEGLLEYGRQRGVRVLPEFEMPGHSGAWKHSHPEIFADMESTAHPPCCSEAGGSCHLWPSNAPCPGTCFVQKPSCCPG